MGSEIRNAARRLAKGVRVYSSYIILRFHVRSRFIGVNIYL
jgi:hypothetical protein